MAWYVSILLFYLLLVGLPSGAVVLMFARRRNEQHRRGYGTPARFTDNTKNQHPQEPIGNSVSGVSVTQFGSVWRTDAAGNAYPAEEPCHAAPIARRLVSVNTGRSYFS